MSEIRWIYSKINNGECAHRFGMPYTTAPRGTKIDEEYSRQFGLVMAWCRDNLSGRAYYYYAIRAIRIDKDEDAVAFRMRWC